MKTVDSIKKYLHRFPVRCAAGSFVTFSVIAFFVPLIIKIAAIIFCTAIFFFYNIISFKRHNLFADTVKSCAVLLAAAAAMSVSAFYFDIYVGKTGEYAKIIGDRQCEIIATVTNVKYEYDYKSAYDVKLEAIGGVRFSYKARLKADYIAGLEIGDRISALCKLTNEPNEYDGDKISLISDGIHIFLDMESGYETLEHGSITFKGLFVSFNQRLGRIIDERVGGIEGGFIKALLLGDREDMPATLTRDMRRLGISHILAISGLHFSILINGITVLFDKLHIYKKYKTAALFIMIPLFMALTGFSPSVLRCGFMNLIALIVQAFHKRIDSVTSLTLATAIILLFSPSSIADIGLIMSVTATMGILCLGQRWNRSFNRVLKAKNALNKLLKYVYGSVFITLSAMLFMLPVMAAVFGELSIISPLSNLLFIPLSEAVLLLSPLILITTVVPPISALIGVAARLVSGLFISAANLLASSFDPIFSLRYDFIPAVILITMFSFIVLIILFRNKLDKLRTLAVLPVIIAIIAYAGFYSFHINSDTALHAIFYSSGKSDGFALMKKRDNYIIDISDGSYSYTYELFGCLDDTRGDEIYAYVLTHLHNRHVKTFERVASEFYIKKLVIPSPVTESDKNISDKLKQLCKKLDVIVIEYAKESETTVFIGEIGITLPVYTKLYRSVHPVILFSAGDGVNSFAYYGGSVFESELREYGDKLIDSVDVAVFGAHSPVIHKNVSMTGMYPKLKRLVIANDEIFSHLNPQLTLPRTVCNGEPQRLF